MHTLDLVVIAAEWGSGRRPGKLSNLLYREFRMGGIRFGVRERQRVLYAAFAFLVAPAARLGSAVVAIAASVFCSLTTVGAGADGATASGLPLR